MRLTTPDVDLAEFGPVREWLHVVTTRMLTVFATSNLYNVLPLVYLDLGIFGTAAMAIVADARNLFRCYSYPIGSFALGPDNRGLTTTFVRDYQLTVRQVVESFGRPVDGGELDWTRMSRFVKDRWDRGDYESPVDVSWMVTPNPAADRARLEARFLPWSSCHFETASADGTLLRESGFPVFPVMAPRWDITGEDSYGTDCPGMTALGDIKQLQIMQRRKGQLLAKAVDPPLAGPSSLRTTKTSLLAGDITYVDVREGMQGLKPIHEIHLEGLQHLTADIGEVQHRIQRAFYEDLFLMLARSDASRGRQRVTAREIDEWHEEKLLALGPVLERTNDELLDLIVDRVYQLMDEAALLPPPPLEVQGVALKVEYISILSQAQKLVGVASQDRFLQTAANLMATFPHVKHKLNVFQAMDDYADMLGVDPRIVIATDAALAAVAGEQQALQAQAAAAQAQQLAAAAKDASQTPLTGDSALDRIVQGINSGMGPAPAPAGG